MTATGMDEGGRYGADGMTDGAWCVKGQNGTVSLVDVYETSDEREDVPDGCVSLMYDVYERTGDGAWEIVDGACYYGYGSVRELCADCLGFDPDGTLTDDGIATVTEIGPDALDGIVGGDVTLEDVLATRHWGDRRARRRDGLQAGTTIVGSNVW